MTFVKYWYVLALVVGLISCGGGKSSSSLKPQTERAASIDLLREIKSSASDETLSQLIEAGADLNQVDRNGVTPFMALVSTRSPELVQLALQYGADVNQTLAFKGKELDAIGFTQAVYGLAATPDVDYETQRFGLSGKGSSDGSLSESDAARLTENFALVRIRQFELGHDGGNIQKLRQEFNQWSRQTRKRINELSQPVATVPEPVLPPVQSFKKSPFETLTMFQKRMDDARVQREQQTSKVLKKYRDQVEARNQKVQQNSEELQQLRAEVSRRNEQYQEQLDLMFSVAAEKVNDDPSRFFASAMADVYGPPFLQAVEEQGAPKYDAERGLMFARLGFSGLSETREVVIPVTAGKGAERFYSKLKTGDLWPVAWFKFEPNGRQVRLNNVALDFEEQQFVARLNQGESFVAQAPVEVVLQERGSLPQLAQQSMAQVVFDDTALSNLKLQNPNVKDVQFEAYLVQEQKAFNDDIPQLLSSVKAAPVDRHNWLFVIGIGEYEQTDDILYSRRSAELFSQVATKVYGIHDSRRIVLLDRQASSGAIQDQLRLMLDKVRAGDRIYFYYSGHGLPVAEKGNAPYLLPADKIPDFIASSDFFQAQSIYRLLENSAASEVIVFMDSCFTGTTDGKSVFGGTKAATRLQPKRLQLAATDKMAVLTAGTDKQFSNALPETGHRLFSYYLMKAMLKGYDRMGDLAGRVTADVSDKSLDLGGLNRQTPVLVGNPNLSIK